ncbi:MAG: MFS transporter [Promethearchaeota archaeon]
MTANEEPETGGTPPSTLKFYGLPRLGTSLLLQLVDFVVFFLYTQDKVDGGVIGLAPLYGGVAAALGKVSIAASQFLVGFASDHTKSRWGKRRPYVLFGPVGLTISFVLLFVPTFVFGYDASQVTYFGWYLTWNCCFQALYGIVTTPYQSMLPEVVANPDRPAASMWQNVFNMLGTGIGVVYTLLGVTAFKESFEETGRLDPGFAGVVVLFGGVLVALFLVMHFKVPASPAEFEESNSNLVENLKVIASNRNFLKMTLMHGIASLAWAMVTALLFGYAEDVLKLSGVLYYAAAAILILGLIGFLALWRKLIERRGKKEALKLIFAFEVVALPFSLVGLVQGDPTALAALGLTFLVAVTCGLAGWYLFPYLIYADAAEDDQRATEENKAGVYTGFPSIPLNLFQALSLFVMGAFVSLPDVPGATFSWGYVLWGPLAAAYLVVAYLYLKGHVVLDFAWEGRGRVEP